MIAIALVCFGLIMTVAWPAMSVLSGTQAAMRGLGLDTAYDQEAVPAAVNTAPPSPEDARTQAFNKEQGRKISGYMRPGGKKGEEGGVSGTKKLTPVQFNKTGPTSIQPTGIGGR